MLRILGINLCDDGSNGDGMIPKTVPMNLITYNHDFI